MNGRAIRDALAPLALMLVLVAVGLLIEKCGAS